MAQEEYTQKRNYLLDVIKQQAINAKNAYDEEQRQEYIDMIRDLVLSTAKNISFKLADELEETARNIIYND